MGKFQIEKCEDIEGLYLIQPTVFGDSRGYFMETYNQKDKMKLHEVLSKFHIGHDQNGATVQQLRAKQEITTICQNQPHSIFYTPQL